MPEGSSVPEVPQSPKSETAPKPSPTQASKEFLSKGADRFGGAFDRMGMSLIKDKSNQYMAIVAGGIGVSAGVTQGKIDELAGGAMVLGIGLGLREARGRIFGKK